MREKLSKYYKLFNDEKVRNSFYLAPIKNSFICRKKSKNSKSKWHLLPPLLLDRRCLPKLWLAPLVAKLPKWRERKSKKQKRRKKRNRQRETRDQVDHAQPKKRTKTASSSRVHFYCIYNFTSYPFHFHPFRKIPKIRKVYLIAPF